MNETKPRPGEVTYAIFAVIVSQLLTAAELVLKKIGIGMPFEENRLGEQVYYWIIGATIAVYLLLALLIYFRKNWARITYMVLTVIMLLPSIPGLVPMFRKSVFTTVMTALEMVFLALALVLLAVKNSAEWFKKITADPADVPPWFR